MNIEPKGKWVLGVIVARPGDGKTSGGIHMPEGAQSMENVGRFKVHGVGPEVTRCKAGDVALVGECIVHKVMSEGVVYILLPEDGVVGIDRGYVAPEAGLVLQ